MAEAVNLFTMTRKSQHCLPTYVALRLSARYENIYHVLSGSKTFTLLSPIEGLWLDRTWSTLLHRIGIPDLLMPLHRTFSSICDSPADTFWIKAPS
jgi:hypothetical protein